jgi:hypothetical protein
MSSKVNIAACCRTLFRLKLQYKMSDLTKLLIAIPLAIFFFIVVIAWVLASEASDRVSKHILAETSDLPLMVRLAKVMPSTSRTCLTARVCESAEKSFFGTRFL